MPVLNANTREFNSSVELMKLYNSYFVTQTHIYILFLPEQWKCSTQKCNYFYFAFPCVFILSILSTFGLLMGKKIVECKRKLWLPDLSLFFYDIMLV